MMRSKFKKSLLNSMSLICTWPQKKRPSERNLITLNFNSLISTWNLPVMPPLLMKWFLSTIKVLSSNSLSISTPKLNNKMMKTNHKSKSKISKRRNLINKKILCSQKMRSKFNTWKSKVIKIKRITKIDWRIHQSPKVKENFTLSLKKWNSKKPLMKKINKE